MTRFSKTLKSKTNKHTVTPEFKSQVKKFIDEHDDVLRKLSKI